MNRLPNPLERDLPGRGLASPQPGDVVQLAKENPGSMRLDRWLAQELVDLSRAQVQKLIEQGQVQVNQHPCTAKNTLVQPGDRLQVVVPELQPLELQPEAIPLEILYEDRDLLIVNKPVGLVVHPAPGHATGTLVHALLAHCQGSGQDSELDEASSLSGIGGVQRPGIVHRLDKDTSGAIAIAKTDQAHRHLQAQIQAKTARRSYVGIVHGSPSFNQGTVNQPIGRHPGDRKKMAVVSTGRQAVTHWQVQERLGNYTLMQFELETGRTHQIRVHSAYLGHPLVGDPVYCSGRRRSLGVNLPGQALHAWRLGLQQPLTQEWIEVTAPLPITLVRLLKALRQRK